MLAVASLAPETGGRVEASAVRNYSPLYRIRETRTPRKLDPAAVATLADGFELREARDTRYHRLLVVDDEDSRFLRFDNSFQSGMYLNDPFRTRFEYTDYLQLGLAYTPTAKRALFIGLGGGSAQKRMWRDFRDLRLQVVELDPDVVAAAYRWFALPRDARLRVDVEDGRRFLRGDDGRWDVIVVDAYYADSIPFHMATVEFVELARHGSRRAARWSSTSSARCRAMRRSCCARSRRRTARSSRPSRSIPSTSTRTTACLTRSATSILVATDGAAPVADVPPATLGEDSRARSRRSGPERGDPRTAGSGPSASTTCRS